MEEEVGHDRAVEAKDEAHRRQREDGDGIPSIEVDGPGCRL
jgi:hypothetical protein